jgi:uncharacterized BrkB/YihY/UPF0761 family membrane protein
MSARDWADALQQRRTIVGFPFGVVKKYGDDQGSRHAALMTYYGFLSLFPLLLLVVVIVSRVLSGDPELRQSIIDAIVPVDFRATVDAAVISLPDGGVPLAIGLVALLFSGLGIVYSGYDTLNHVAAVPHRRRIPLVTRYLRIVAMLLLLIVGTAGIGMGSVAAGALQDVPGVSRVAAFASTTALTFLLLWLATMLLLPHRGRLVIVWPAALLGAVVVSAVLTFGAAVLPRLIARSGAVYGSFATIVGLFALIFLVSQSLVFAAEIAIVRRRHLWPRGLDGTRPTEADRRALTYQARMQERLLVERITATFDAPVPERDRGSGS